MFRGKRRWIWSFFSWFCFWSQGIQEEKETFEFGNTPIPFKDARCLLSQSPLGFSGPGIRAWGLMCDQGYGKNQAHRGRKGT